LRRDGWLQVGLETLKDLRTEGFSASVLEAVEALTKREREVYEAFIRRVAPHPVTPADLRDNSGRSRIEEPTERDRQRIRKHRRAIEYMEGCGTEDVQGILVGVALRSDRLVRAVGWAADVVYVPAERARSGQERNGRNVRP
jgi:hypothetical protein